MGMRIHRKQDNYYPVLHWLTSLVAAPFVLYLGLLLFEGQHLPELLGFFWLYFVYGIFCSLPVFVIYFICFLKLASRFESALNLKAVFNTGVIIGAIVTFILLDFGIMNKLILTYGITIILCSLFFNPFIKIIEQVPEP